MKLLRYGEVGSERPGLLDADGKIRDLSAHVADIAGTVLHPASLDMLSKLPLVEGNPRIGPCVAGTGKFICIGLNYSDHAAETGATVPPEPITIPSSTSQSVLTEPRGIITSSLGPQIALVALVNTTGSGGTVRPDSAAWSA